MNTKVWKYFVALWLLMLAMPMQAQKFYNLTADEVKVDSVLPRFVYSKPLPDNYQDSIYTATVKYGEYVDMTVADIANYNRISGAALPSQVAIEQNISLCRKKGTFVVSFCPLVFRNNKYQILVSFMLDVKAKPVSRSQAKALKATRASEGSDGYADHSVLATGKWAKIRVSETGVCQLSESVVRQAGFTNINKVRIYGYGGNLQNEALYASDIKATDDLKEVPQCIVGGKHLFYAKGPVSWSSSTISRRTRNPYSDYGYYFITQTDEEPATVDSAAFVSSFYPSNDDYHSLYEVDGYSWYHGGRNLFDPTAVAVGASKTVVIANPTENTSGRLAVNVSAGNTTTVEVSLNGAVLGQQTVEVKSTYDKGGENEKVYTVSGLHAMGRDTVVIKTLSGGPSRLDYASMTWSTPKPSPTLSGSHPVAQYVYNITNQDHHADGFADLVILIPTSQKLLQQAQRLKAFHESHDGLRVNIVPADELYNEFSSGTPDAGAYRRYLRMLSDKATSEADMPKYLLLFGDCVWDNRMLTSDCKSFSPDDYLLCYESENSFSELYCYVSDSWLGILSEGAGKDPRNDQQDVAVGRFPVTTVEDAKTLVDKTISYMNNANAGAWQNTLMFMADDGNDNLHMRDENEVAEYISGLYPHYLVKKVMWDVYQRETSSTGNTYPDATKAIKQQQAQGALIMDYAGHGSESQLSHEKVLAISDFQNFTNANLPLWITAACDIMPFDGTTSNIGETALLNSNGGAVAFYGTTRTVYADRNKYMNRSFLRRVLSTRDGKPMTIGEAHRLAQNDLLLGYALPNGTTEQDNTTNRLQYSLLGDPALSLNLPTLEIVVDSINGMAASDTQETPVLKAGMVARMTGHIVGAADFDGVVTATVRDSRELVTCRNNEGSDNAFTYYDRLKTLYNGSDSVRGGKFSFRFAVPKDINYSGASGLVTLYAVNGDKTLRAQGASDAFKVGGSALEKNDSIGPSIYCYLNTSSFVDGGRVNPTPYFVAEISDKDGINVTGSGIGHDLQLVIDGDASKTYNLNDNFTYDFGTYTSGSTYYSIPELEAGPHKLQFRAWDILNNCSTATLNFQVVKRLKPSFDMGVTENPAKGSTTFIINHDRAASQMDVVIEVYDTSGRMLWNHAESGVPGAGTYTVKWDLSTGSGTLRTGLYLYRVKVSSDGSAYEAKTKKLIVINN